MKKIFVALSIAFSAVSYADDVAISSTVSHAISMFGSEKYPKDFPHFDYVYPDAPKGGNIVLSALGTFDNLNPFIDKGQTAANVSSLWDSLLVSSDDEPDTYYGLLAKTIEYPEDRSWVIFTLRRGAKWHDGMPITADDVIFTFDVLQNEGSPNYKLLFQDIENIEKTDKYKVKFTFKDESQNRENPMNVGTINILPRHYWEGKTFNKTTLIPPLGSGAYKIKEFEPGKYITYELYPNYWGKDLGVNVGQNNFEEVRYDYYRDRIVIREALKSGDIDFLTENQSKAWNSAYDIPAVQEGRLKKVLLTDGNVQGTQAFFLNTRRPQFSDRRVRQALGLVFDFEWTNKTLFFDQYTRMNSNFANSELAATGLPTEQELEILKKFKDRLPSEVFTSEFKMPITDGSGTNRTQIRQALNILKDAGWNIIDNKLVNSNGEQMNMEFLLYSPDMERVILPYIQNLEKLGVNASIRMIDTSQWINRVREFDFDLVTYRYGQGLTPGTEQLFRWGSKSADTKDSVNFSGAADPVIDEILEMLTAAKTREDLVATTKALDRVLLWQFYGVLNWYLPNYRVLYWDKFTIPANRPKYSLGFNTWYMKP